MTAVVGIRCTNGVVLGTDSSATFSAGQARTIEQPTEKLHVLADRVIVAGTGSVGLGQRFRAVVEDLCEDRFYNQRADAVELGKQLARKAKEDFGETGAPKNKYGALVAFPRRNDTHLCEFDVETFQPELKPLSGIWYCSMGSSQHITDPFLGFIREVFWQEGPPSVNQALFALTWTLDHAVQVNPGGVKDPISVAVLEEDQQGGSPSAYRLDEEELGEVRISIEDAKETLREFPNQLTPEAAGDREVPEPGNGE